MTSNPIIKEDLLYIYNSETNWRVFANSTILITGANGFIPAYLVEFFLFLNTTSEDLNISVIGLVRNEVKAKQRFSDYSDNKYLKLIVQDVCDDLNIQQPVDYIFHAASQASPKYYGIDPVGTLYPNVIGTINLLNFAKLKKIKSFLYFSSGEVYGDVKLDSIEEKDFGYLDPVEVRSCYGESKRMGENICVSYYHQYGVNVKIVRPFHTYGPGMSLDDGRVFADFIKNIINKEDIILNSDGSSVRAFCYLSDATIGFIKILISGANGEAYNIGNPYEEISIKKLAQTLIDLYSELNLKLTVENKLIKNGYLVSNVNKIVPNINKALSLGWQPSINVINGFKRTIKSFY